MYVRACVHACVCVRVYMCACACMSGTHCCLPACPSLCACLSPAGGRDDRKATLPQTIVLKHMFRREEVVQDPSVITEVEADVALECGKMGAVETVKVRGPH